MSFKSTPKRVNKVLNNRIEQMLKNDIDKKGCLPIVKMGDEVLRKKCPDYNADLAPETLQKLIKTMKVTMREAPGVGLAAPQIGLNLNLAVLEDRSAEAEDFDPAEDDRETALVEFFVAINPRYEPIEDADGLIHELLFYEGCLSFAEHYAARYRFHKIRAFWTDEKGRDHEEVLTGWPARIFQHETDHLHGEVYIDKAIIRSLSTSNNLSENAWDDDLQYTAKALGFDLEE
ncbi:MAG: peptide deformylase [Candidatus Ancillula sp.]|jgi:peptide deformylase|nr:peptide deformylase [Candidatus Ancillula sp.]